MTAQSLNSVYRLGALPSPVGKTYKNIMNKKDLERREELVDEAVDKAKFWNIFCTSAAVSAYLLFVLSLGVLVFMGVLGVYGKTDTLQGVAAGLLLGSLYIAGVLFFGAMRIRLARSRALKLIDDFKVFANDELMRMRAKAESEALAIALAGDLDSAMDEGPVDWGEAQIDVGRCGFPKVGSRGVHIEKI